MRINNFLRLPADLPYGSLSSRIGRETRLYHAYITTAPTRLDAPTSQCATRIARPTPASSRPSEPLTPLARPS
jgi:hypothetical protein